MKRMIARWAFAALAVATPVPAVAQSVAARTPNLSGGWYAAPGVIQFNFLHRFSMSEAPLRKITNTPTFTVASGIVNRLMAGFTYGSNSALVPSYPNEWELFTRVVPLDQETGDPVTISLQTGYNVASESADAELQLARALGPLRLLAAGRAFSDGYDGADPRYAVAGGAVLHLTSMVSLAADYAVLLDRAVDEPAAWGAGLQLGVPYTPHSFSIHVSNVGTASLEGASRGTRMRFGFEYTVPITIRRYIPHPTRDGESGTMPRDSTGARQTRSPLASTDTVRIAIESLKYGREEITIDPGTTVVWTNRDPVVHSVTSDDGDFDSGLIQPGEWFAMTFLDSGVFDYSCTPHPFMHARVVVRAAMENTP